MNWNGPDVSGWIKESPLCKIASFLARREVFQPQRTGWLPCAAVPGSELPAPPCRSLCHRGEGLPRPQLSSPVRSLVHPAVASPRLSFVVLVLVSSFSRRAALIQIRHLIQVRACEQRKRALFSRRGLAGSTKKQGMVVIFFFTTVY